MENKKIEVCNTKEIYNDEILKTVKANNIYLHSRYYPLKEAYEIVKELDIKDKKNIVIYGIGAGYHIFQILQMKNTENFKLKIFDLEKECFEQIRQNYIMKEILKDSRVEIFIDGINENFLEEFSRELSKSDFFYVYKPSLKIISDDNKLKEVILEYEAQKMAEKGFREEIESNLVLNEKVQAKDMISFFKECNLENKVVIIVAAGPSLDLCIEDLKKIRESEKNIKIIAVGTALRPLLCNFIEPDVFCIIDPQEVVYEQIRGYENLNIPMCFLSTSSSKTVLSYNGPKYIFYNYSNKSDIVIECANSVATAAISIAIMGKAKSIVLVGQDLAFTREKRHSDNTMYGEKHAYHLNSTDIKGIGVDGVVLKTTTFYVSIKKWIEKIIRLNPQICFINSSKGLKIQGTVEMPLYEVKGE